MSARKNQLNCQNTSLLFVDIRLIFTCWQKFDSSGFFLWYQKISRWIELFREKGFFKLSSSFDEKWIILVTFYFYSFHFSEKELPNSFRALERAHVHQRAKSLDLLSKSRGKGANRAVTIYKKGSLNYLKNDSKINLTQNSRKAVMQSISQSPLTRQERQDLVPTTERDRLKGM
jgi:hypothetical protein